ncbi:Crp/Fnr family transcriptional regulator [Proteiniclasticum sp. SCR006]|uniref:Crp/Fnr family transcriptional regulator n=1 Tax=Proteiniclasticum aestuarii TaxID=2817862 RepID=A0A939H7T4_9CLOT|nr:Crp/Fnr family transcriptional regulator [Proteiniclasticum aestuarii]MBO1263583.1 Crp/Fnr family transcriptional regulator [Proteiniclasticum aestuarii]
MVESYLKLLMENPLFREMSRDEIGEMLSGMGAYIASYSKNETITVENEKLHGIGIVLRGMVSIGKDTSSGDRLMMARLSQGDIFGEVAVYTGSLWTATVLAEKDATILFLPAEKLMNAEQMSSNAASRFTLNMLYIIAKKARALNDKLELLSLKSIRRKICFYLLKQHQSRKQSEFMVPLRRIEMAEYLQVSRPSLSRELIRLKEEGIIDFEGRNFKLIDIERISKELKK